MAGKRKKTSKAPGRPGDLAVVVLAAGLGRRMRSARAKVLHEVAGRPMVLHVLEAAAKLDPSRSLVVVGHQADDVSEAVGDRAECVLQAEQLGTGHALSMTRAALRGFKGDLLVLAGDVPLVRTATLKRLLAKHRHTAASVTVLTTVVDDPAGYGRMVRDDDGGGLRIAEDADASTAEKRIDEINSAIYCFDVRFLFRALSRLGSDNAQDEYYLTDVVEMASRRSAAATVVAADETEVLGVDSRAALASAEALMQERLISGWMDKGVTFVDPASVHLSVDTTIGRDTVIGPQVKLDGATRIGRRCAIDGVCHLSETTVGDGTRVRWGVVADHASVGNGVSLGPYAHLRPAAELADEVHIGNFVEVKKSRIGKGSKANHLSYIGDAEVGEAVNIGAGTITCNYDGFDKHRTVIGDRVQIGSDTQLVAPVEIGADSYIAAGSTVSSDVEPGSLAFNDKKQRTRKNWVKNFRKRQSKLRRGDKGG